MDAEDKDYDFAGAAEKNWQPVAAPGEPEMQGFELKNNTEYYYRRKVDIPKDFAGKKCLRLT